MKLRDYMKTTYSLLNDCSVNISINHTTKTKKEHWSFEYDNCLSAMNRQAEYEHFIKRDELLDILFDHTIDFVNIGIDYKGNPELSIHLKKKAKVNYDHYDRQRDKYLMEG